jgi:hypothetical protein
VPGLVALLREAAIEDDHVVVGAGVEAGSEPVREGHGADQRGAGGADGGLHHHPLRYDAGSPDRDDFELPYRESDVTVFVLVARVCSTSADRDQDFHLEPARGDDRARGRIIRFHDCGLPASIE